MGTFDDIIRKEMTARGVNSNADPKVFDQAMLAANQRHGRDPLMKLLGINQNVPNEVVMPNGQQQQQQVAQPVQRQPQASQMRNAIDAQVGNVPVPTPRPRTDDESAEVIPDNESAEVQQMGDGSVMEQIQQRQAVSSPMDQAIDAQTANPQPAPSAAPAQPITQDTNTSDNSIDPKFLLLLALAGGSVEGMQKMKLRAQSGDPEALATFKQIGMDPNSVDQLMLPAPQQQQMLTGSAQQQQLTAPEQQKLLPAPEQFDNSRFSDVPDASSKQPRNMTGTGMRTENVDDAIVRKLMEMGSGSPVPRARPKAKVK